MSDRDWRPFIYGGVASITAEFGTFPIDTTKTRLQVQGQKLDKKFSALKYRGMIDAFRQISRQEGVRALYSGIWPAILRQGTYGTIKFGTYYRLKKFTIENKIFSVQSDGESVFGNIVCAATAGAVSSAIANPTDVLKVRMQIQGRQSKNSSLVNAFREIYKLEGVRGLWRGVGPTAQRAVVIAAVELPVYDSCKAYLMDIFGDQITNHFISSFVASFGSAVASTPLDVIRTRLMNQKCIQIQSNSTADGAIAPQIYRGSIDCALQTIRNEGVRACYKGFIPTWVRMGPWNIIFFVTYEQLKLLY